ncbi:MAG: guanine deaminase [Candidatus Solibacter usitatus]|nr:guanine deaminase [Candidatus Solibacter usitatus]
MKPTLYRGALFHTPRNPFHEEKALQAFADGALVIAAGRIAACGSYAEVGKAFPDVDVRDLRGGFLLPGFIDTHVHYPQIRALGCLGLSLLDWLERNTLPEEVRFQEEPYARRMARLFLHALASHGTTTALVFGSHFEAAMRAFFETAATSGLRIASGLVVADRALRPELHSSPDRAYEQGSSLIRAFHSQGRLSYAVTPRFALSTSEAMLEACGALLREHPDLLCTTHWNENAREVSAVNSLFPGDADYLAVYERFGLAGPRTVLAHSVQSQDHELKRLAALGASVAHCPCSNAALGSGIFPMRRHLAAGVPFALGTDVGGGTGFGMLKESLHSYLMQRVSADGFPLQAAHLLYLATRAGAQAMGLESVTGDFSVGKAADFVYLRAPAESPLDEAARAAESEERLLSSVITLADAACVREVYVEGEVVYRNDAG